MGFRQTIKIFYIYIKPYRRRFVLGILALLGVDILNIFPPLVLKSFIDHISPAFHQKNFLIFLELGLLYTTIAIGQGIFRYLWRTLLIQASYQAAEALRNEYFSKLQKLPSSFYDKNPIGDLMALATNDVEAVRFALGPGLLVFADAIFLFLSLPPVMILLSPKLTLFSVLPLIIIPFLVIFLEKRLHKHFNAVQEQFSNLSSFSQENLEGIRIIKAFVREWTQLGRFSNLGKEFVRLNLKLAKVQSVFDPLFGLIISLGLISLLLFSGNEIIAGTISIGTFVAFTRYLDQLLWPLTAFGTASIYYQQGKTSLERVLTVLNEKEERSTSSASPMIITENKKPLLEATGLTFTYPGKHTPAFKNINFKIEAGSTTALIGRVGSGKTTLVRLLTGIYEPPPGMLFLRGTDITTLPLTYLRNEFAVVPQENFLFSESLRWNILLGLKNDFEGKTIDSSYIYNALKYAGLEPEMKVWDLDMPISERGMNLSGGQRARIALARAMLCQSSLLILDDALASVDTETESKILGHLKEIRAVRKEQALLMITHRLTGLEKFDQVLILEQGELIQKRVTSFQRIENVLSA